MRTCMHEPNMDEMSNGQERATNRAGKAYEGVRASCLCVLRLLLPDHVSVLTSGCERKARDAYVERQIRIFPVA